MGTVTVCRICGDKAAATCYKCGASGCDHHIRFYHDDSNRAINASAKPQCTMCFPPKFPRPYTLHRAVERDEWELP